MKPVCNTINFLDNERIYQVSEHLSSGVQFDLYVQIQSEKFVEYQKEILQEFVADFLDKAQDVTLSSRDLEQLLENELQKLNDTLQAFAEKLRDVPKCDLRGFVQVLIDQTVKTWMIGKSTLMIFRDDKLYSVVENSFQEQVVIDQFTDFIGGEIERGDVFLYAGTKLSESLDQQDINGMEQILGQGDSLELLWLLQDTLASRIEKTEIGFLSSFSISRFVVSTSSSSIKGGKIVRLAKKYLDQRAGKIDLWAFTTKTQRYWKWNNQYYIVAGVLGVMVLFLAYAVVSQFKSGSQGVAYTTSSGAVAYLTLDEIKGDILSFKVLDSSSDQKSEKYAEILQKLQLLESKGLWPNDVQKFKSALTTEYEKGFNVISITDLKKQLDDEATGIKTQIFTFSSAEKEKIGTPVSVNFAGQLNIAGTKGAFIGAVNENTRGSLIEYNLASDAKSCGLSLSKKGLFCYTTGGELFYVGKAGVETMETADGQWSTTDIGGIGTYGKNNLYIFQHSPNNFASVFVTRYQNEAGAETRYRNAQNYAVAVSGSNFPAQMAGFAIDGNFLAWGDGKLYQFWRASSVGTALDSREVMLHWGDKVSSTYSSNVKVIVSDNSPYVYFFDQDNQTFTVFDSSPIKTHENYKTSFNLYYMFRFKFDLSASGNRVVDAAIPYETADKLELYLLTNEGINKINLSDFIDRLKGNKALKEVAE